MPGLINDRILQKERLRGQNRAEKKKFTYIRIIVKLNTKAKKNTESFQNGRKKKVPCD